MSSPDKVVAALRVLEDYLVVTPSPAPPVDTVSPPYGVSNTLMTIFGLNWDGSLDQEDNGRGAWGANTRLPELVGCALPIKVIQATFGSLEASHIKGYTVECYSQVTHKTVAAADIVDLGPSERLHRGIDGTYGLHKALGHLDIGTKPAGFHVAYWINDPNGKPVEIKGWDFANGRVIGS